MTFESFLNEVEESVDMHQLIDELGDDPQSPNSVTVVPVTCAETASLASFGGVC